MFSGRFGCEGLKIFRFLNWGPKNGGNYKKSAEFDGGRATDKYLSDKVSRFFSRAPLRYCKSAHFLFFFYSFFTQFLTSFPPILTIFCSNFDHLYSIFGQFFFPILTIFVPILTIFVLILTIFVPIFTTFFDQACFS